MLNFGIQKCCSGLNEWASRYNVKSLLGIKAELFLVFDFHTAFDMIYLDHTLTSENLLNALFQFMNSS